MQGSPYANYSNGNEGGNVTKIPDNIYGTPGGYSFKIK